MKTFIIIIMLLFALLAALFIGKTTFYGFTHFTIERPILAIFIFVILAALIFGI